MSDKWEFFPCQMGEHRASIFFDYGIRESMDTAVPPNLLKVRIVLSQPRPDGLSASEEFQKLSAFEDDLLKVVQQRESCYVGRITVDGHRHFYIYTCDPEAGWSAQLAALGETHGYAISFVMTEDENHKGYWQELFPTEDDWQVILDLRVLEHSEKRGDNLTLSRRIDHWAYFPSRGVAEEFSQWLEGEAYVSVTLHPSDDDRICVHFSHEGSLRLEDITRHTIALRRKASELKGEYDGWETPICGGKTSE
jgi:hypothetical protein